MNYIVLGADVDPDLAESPVVGCNPCVLQCGLPGSPPIPTTTTHTPIRTSITKKKKKPSVKTTKKAEGKIKQKSSAGVVVGLVILSLAIVSIAVGATVWYFRFRK